MTFRAWTRPRFTLVAVASALAVALAGGCSRGRPAQAVARVWLAGVTEPAFDPDGPPEVVRWALERCLARGLVDRDRDGRVRLALAESLAVSPDSLTWTFRLRRGLRFSDGTPLTSADVRDALTGGLGREDHATRAWLLACVQGVDHVRAGRPLPPLGIQAPDARTLVLQLRSRDPRLLESLALPGVSTPWRRRGGDWAHAAGAGPYRVAGETPGRELVLVRADSAAGAVALADTLRVRFVVGAVRARAVLRAGVGDLAWPLPPGLLDQPLPAGWRLEKRAASPARRLLLVLRADVPPLTRLPARHALAHALNREALFAALGPRAVPPRAWLPGAEPFAFPSFDADQVRTWMARGRLGVSFHVVLGYDADRSGAEIARVVQGQWARFGVYAELRGLRGREAAAQALAATAPQAQLVVEQAPLTGAAAELATLVMPLRGPAVGSFRTGWRTREFDPWILTPAPARALDPNAAQQRLDEDRVALPIADLPWLWAVREGADGTSFDPRFGPEYARAARAGGPGVRR